MFSLVSPLTLEEDMDDNLMTHRNLYEYSSLKSHGDTGKTTVFRK